MNGKNKLRAGKIVSEMDLDKAIAEQNAIATARDIRNMTDKTHIKVFVTKNRRFRAIIEESDKTKYSVTIGGDQWKKGKGRKHKELIYAKMKHIVRRLEDQVREFN